MKYFISDLHLSSHEPEITRAFLAFLQNEAPKASALYILGDFFEYYIGDDDPNPFLASMIEALKQLTDTGFPVFFMHGNRDFLIGKQFAKKTGVVLIKDPTLITMNNQKIVLMHGDSLCTLDKQHQRFRKITRNKIIQKVFLLLPLSYRLKLAHSLRNDSMEENRYQSLEITDVTQSTIDRIMQQYHADKLIHGHTHRPMVTEKRIVLGSWEKQPNYLKMDEQGNVELINL